MAHSPAPSRPHWPTLALTAAALILAAISLGVAVQSADSGTAPLVSVPTATPVPTGAMWSLGTGGGEGEPYHEWVAVYPTSTLWNILGAPSLRLFDHAPNEPGQDRSFEIGFYKYGPTLYTANHIVEFWIGGEGGGTLSVIGNEGAGGQLEVRNPTDTDHISLDYRQADRPRISAGKNPLYLAADGGLVSESSHTFARGFDVPPQSGHAGQVREGWQDGAVTVPTRAVNADSLVLITPVSEPRGRWWVSAIATGESFTVRSTAHDEDMAFNWLVIN